eukprot:CAMPEP_0181428138 /NCGR_PEP_ID=MMETSP1110-20121109/16527_1 /TAXON_ID=174948 /ORGANISM="Symbiodinium sp., Strain CCMP421" /LENGTH=584 /DNA_ID=CAMNT_0023551361 /DNA_START=62 /DNA_END=1816 /DNA_ORIENTATION=-
MADRVSAAMDKVRALGLDPSELRERDVKELQTSKVISRDEADQLRAACKVRAGQAARKRLPFPELEERNSLEPRKLEDFKCMLPPRVPSTSNGAHVPYLDLHALDAQQWLKVFLNCNLTRGCMSQDKLNPSCEHVLIPRNTDLSQYLVVAQQFDIFESRMSMDTVHTHSVVMSEASAFAKVTKPWVSAAVEFKKSTESQTVRKGSTYLEISKRRLPVGKLSLVLGSSIQVEDSQTDAAFEVNPNLIESVQSLLNTRQQITMDDMQNEIFERFGDVIALEAEIGIAMYKTKEEISKTTQDISADWLSIQGKAGGGVGGFGAEGGGGYQKKTQNTTQKGSASAAEHWQVIGAVSATSEEGLKSAQSEPGCWRAIHYGRFIPVTDLLPAEMRKQLTERFQTPEVPKKVAQTPSKLDPRGKTFVRLKDGKKFSIVGNIEYWSDGDCYEIVDGGEGKWITPSVDMWKVLSKDGTVKFKGGDRAKVEDWGKPLHFNDGGYVHPFNQCHRSCDPTDKTFVRLRDAKRFSVVGNKEYWSDGDVYDIIMDGDREGMWKTPSVDMWKVLWPDGSVQFQDRDRAFVCNWGQSLDW